MREMLQPASGNAGTSNTGSYEGWGHVNVFTATSDANELRWRGHAVNHCSAVLERRVGVAVSRGVAVSVAEDWGRHSSDFGGASYEQRGSS